MQKRELGREQKGAAARTCGVSLLRSTALTTVGVAAAAGLVLL